MICVSHGVIHGTSGEKKGAGEGRRGLFQRRNQGLMDTALLERHYKELYGLSE